MLKLVDIKKDYVTKGVPTVHALKGLTINFRRNEFVAILGASGCGKTTLLNIIGGLDRYTDGDLIIEGKSTKDYKDGDWDTYRNHSVGFVFQSYNLIQHQTILRNVELALTISGIKKEERRARAMEAIKKVGLEGMEKKRPNQLSGGQMQRVAIARALVNNPEILLADEPTGALDSETSVQIMDLLKEVASDRLVIMVTHNPDLAYKYATRIVKMSDGLLLDDSKPYKGETKEQLEKALKEKQAIIDAKGNKKQTSMSFFTATGLSFSNLWSKLKRTILIAVAGSIGIIGVSSVLAVSFGVNHYIDNLQDDMLSEYPLTISETAVDYTSLLNGLSNWDKKDIATIDPRTEVGVNSMIDYLMDKYQDFTQVKNNEINKELLAFLEDEKLPRDAIAATNYDYGLDVTNNIFVEWQRGAGYTEEEKTKKHNMSLNGLTQMYISELKTVEGFSQYAQFVKFFTNFMHQLPDNKDFIMSQYDFVGDNSRYPENENELLLVVDEDQCMTDFLLAQMGYFPEPEFLNVSKQAIKVHELREKLNKKEITQQEFDEQRAILAEKYPYRRTFQIEEVLNKHLTYYSHKQIWEYKERTVQTAKGSIKMYENPLQPDKGTTDVRYSLAYNEQENILEGTFSAPSMTGGRAIDVQLEPFDASTPSDPNKPYIGKWKLMEMESEQYHMTIHLNLEIFADGKTIISADEVPLPLCDEDHSIYTVNAQQHNTYYYSADAKSSWGQGQELRIVGLLKRKEKLKFGSLSRGAYYPKSFADRVRSHALESDIVNHDLHGIKKYIGSEAEKDGDPYEAFVEYKYTSFRKGDHDPDVKYDINGYASALNNGTELSNLISLTSNSTTDTDKSSLRLVSGLSTKEIYNEAKTVVIDYEFAEAPQTISIYPKDFDNKKKITKYLDTWNDDSKTITVTIDGQKVDLEPGNPARQELTYTDTIQIIVTIINTLIQAITIALVAFSSLALVVSCFMIAVITYISTMERVKEIGVIRSLGGRKKDVSRLFIAETLIIGFASGVIGIAITYLLELILNLSVTQFGIFGIAALPIWMAGLMVLLSVFLNVVSGFIPSKHASRQDPVVALRSE